MVYYEIIMNITLRIVPIERIICDGLKVKNLKKKKSEL